MSYSMFEIMREFEDIYDELESSDGELTPELEERLAINRNEFVEKIDKMKWLVNYKNSEIVTLKESMAHSAFQIQSANNVIARVKKVMKEAIMQYGEKKVSKETGSTSYSVKLEDGSKKYVQAAPVILINDEEQVPDIFKRVKFTLPFMPKKVEDEVQAKIKEIEAILEKNDVEAVIKTEHDIQKTALLAYVKEHPEDFIGENPYAEIDPNYYVK